MGSQLKVRRKRRSKKDLEDIINNAALELIKENGFHNITVTSIMQKAEIEPIVFYNRYEDLNAFIDEFVKKYDYWFSEVINKIEFNNPQKQYISILATLLESLQGNKGMQQLLRWEIASYNDTTIRTARLREFHTLPLVDKYKKIFENSQVEIDAVSAVVIGGIYYLVLHSDLSEFAGIDINSKDGKEKIQRALEYLGRMFFDDTELNPKLLKIARNMKSKGYHSQEIAEIIELPVDLIDKL
ncbi:MAG: TetR/AcrR family transcriptional regulator [Bacteroidales bacterium]|jgi:AcrR family transcriptional regulator|nr:TetR/AcrR family transcriptional regulator [Synergistaceae bacterium]MDD2330518.1 TetR/AcrR family transcriptional regulator [Bacteroidales bacterium]MDD3105472.1 TetR/AcrR family transcriptional regulator [Bacteroidales bacterium]MDD3550119.1 TetR/AcrR family transcriptional regulator [Bacteroidales bacterium]MDY0316375.1 TetR/AcrR family transcriptional regulator [Acholeplasmatales bacterium]